MVAAVEVAAEAGSCLFCRFGWIVQDYDTVGALYDRVSALSFQYLVYGLCYKWVNTG